MIRPLGDAGLQAGTMEAITIDYLPVSATMDTVVKESSSSSAGTFCHSCAAPNHWSPSKGDIKCWKCGLCETARAPINSSVPVILRRHASKCRLQCTWPSASARCWARQEALRRDRKVSNRSDWSGCPPYSAHSILNCADSIPTELRPGAVRRVRPFRCSTSHPGGHSSRLGR